jgi:O-antigen/teichoic acid export membrane protein
MVSFLMIRKTFSVANTRIGKGSVSNVKHLLKICRPLCIGVTLSIYIGNSPKYMIDVYMNEEAQAIFGYIMLPVFAITLLNQFIYQPVVKDLGDLWAKKDVRRFRDSILIQCLIVLGLTVVVIIGGLLVGLPVLSVMYNINLTNYTAEFALLLVGGSLYALAYYLNVPLTTIRKQNYIAVGYLAATCLSLILGRYFVVTYGMLGAAFLYLCVNALLVAVYAVVLVLGVKAVR